MALNTQADWYWRILKIDIRDITKQLKAQKYVAIYNIFSQQALHQYFKYVSKNKTAPFDLSRMPDADGPTITIDSYFQMLKNISLEPVAVKRAANSFINGNKKSNNIFMWKSRPWLTDL